MIWTQPDFHTPIKHTTPVLVHICRTCKDTSNTMNGRCAVKRHIFPPNTFLFRNTCTCSQRSPIFTPNINTALAIMFLSSRVPRMMFHGARYLHVTKRPHCSPIGSATGLETFLVHCDSLIKSLNCTIGLEILGQIGKLYSKSVIRRGEIT